jgi:hypothetical protein
VSVGIEAAVDHAAFGSQVGVARHDEATSLRGDLHLGITSIRDIMKLRRLEWAASIFAGFDWTTGTDRDTDYRDVTFPVGLGLTFLTPLGDSAALSLQPRYNLHVGDETPTDRRHELVVSVGFHFLPPIGYKSKN